MRWINDFKLEIQVPPPGYTHDGCTIAGVVLAPRAAAQVGAKRCVVCNELIDPTPRVTTAPATRLVQKWGARGKPKQVQKTKIKRTALVSSGVAAGVAESLEHELRDVLA